MLYAQSTTKGHIRGPKKNVLQPQVQFWFTVYDTVNYLWSDRLDFLFLKAYIQQGHSWLELYQGNVIGAKCRTDLRTFEMKFCLKQSDFKISTEDFPSTSHSHSLKTNFGQKEK